MRKVLWIALLLLLVCGAFSQEVQRSWWCANEEWRGYNNGWLQALTTPDIVLPSSPTGDLMLSFMMNMNIEEPAVYEDYDGWDGFNVRISTDGGSTFEVIEPVDGYDCTSMYGFGYNGEGAGVPGWGGSSDGWVQKQFNLNAYAGETVQVRFVFGSDPAFCTIDDGGDPTMFGVLVDNIVIADDTDTCFFDDGGNSGSSELVGTDLIKSPPMPIITDAMAHSGTYSIFARNAYDTTYKIVTPSIHIPDGFLATASFWVYRDIPDENGDDDDYLDDYYVVYVSTDEGLSWDWVAVDWNHPGLDPTWSFLENDDGMNRAEPGLMLYDYMGMDIQFMLEFNYDGNDDGGVGTGVYIDDFAVYGFYGFTYDAGVSNVFTSPINVDQDVLYTIEITGYGVESINPNVYYRIYDSLGTELDFGLLGSASVSFGEHRYRSFTWRPSDPGDYYIISWTTSGADEDPSNDSLRFDFTVPDEHNIELGYDDAVLDTFGGSYLYLTPGLDTLEEIGDGYAVDFETPFAETHLNAISIKGAGIGNIVFALFELTVDGPGFLPETTWTTSLPDSGIDKEVFLFELPEDYVVPFDSFIIAVWAADTESYILPGIDRTTPHDGHSWITDFETDYYNFRNLAGASDPYNEFDFMIRCFVDDGSGLKATLSSGAITLRHDMMTTEPADIETLFYDDFETGDLAGWDSAYTPYVWWHITDDSILVYDDTDIKDRTKPCRFALRQNIPNPFNPTTDISFSVPSVADVSLVIYDISGKAVRTLVNEQMQSGEHRIMWNGKDDNGIPMPSGIYFYRLKVGEQMATRKMMLIR